MPWQPSDGGHAASEVVKMEDMMLLVDTMLENTATDDEKVQHCKTFILPTQNKAVSHWVSLWCRLSCQVLRSPTRFTLGSMLSHFQKLFDVGSLSGVYPRMNEVYSRLGEATNTMRNLRDVLQLGGLQLESRLHIFLSDTMELNSVFFPRQTAGFLLQRW